MFRTAGQTAGLNGWIFFEGTHGTLEAWAKQILRFFFAKIDFF